MKTRLLLALTTCASLGASAALANGFYVSGTIGGVFRDTVSSVLNETTDPFGNRAFINGVAVPYQVQQRTHYEAGGEADVAGGYRFGLGRFGALRVEGEFSFRDLRFKDYVRQSLPGQIYGTNFHATYETDKGLYQERYAETANAFYDLPSFGFATPYVGVGAGYQESVRTPGDVTEVFQDTRYPTGEIFGPRPTASGVRSIALASTSVSQGTWLTEAGLSLRMTPHLSLVPSYRFTQAFQGHAATNLARLGLRYSF